MSPKPTKKKPAKKASKRPAAAPAPKRPRGGQTLRTPAIEEEILSWIASGETLRAYCRQPGKVARRTIDQWRETDPAFDARFARARATGHDELAEKALEIASTVQIGEVVTIDKDGKSTITRADMPVHRKLEVHTILQLLEKWDRRYSRKHEHKHEGNVGLVRLVEASMEGDDDE